MHYCYIFEKEIKGEIWRTIKDSDIYEISNFGRVRCVQRQRGSHYKHEDYPIILKQRICSKGYCMCGIKDKHGNKKLIRVHRYVAYSFIENKKNLPQINHKNGEKLNNKVDNLEWITNDDNMRHSYDIGLRETSSRGTNNGRSLLTEEQVVDIYISELPPPK